MNTTYVFKICCYSVVGMTHDKYKRNIIIAIMKNQTNPQRKTSRTEFK